MSPNKRKMIVSDESEEDDSFKHRRSSLQVNLSYSTDLTDSGNGSLWKTEIANDERETNKTQIGRRLSRSKTTHKKKNRQSDCEENVVNDSRKPLCKERIPLKRLTIDLEDVSIKEKTLETNCKRLKDAILNKTKEIFDRQNELSIKTAVVLGSEKNHCMSSTHEVENDAEDKLVIMLDTTINLENKATVLKHKQHTVNNQQRENGCSGITATPTSSGKQNSMRTLDKSRLSQRLLFVEPADKQKCRIIEDIILEKKFPLLSLWQADPGNSPILSSSSNRRLSLSKSRSQSQFENHNSTYSAVRCDQSVNIGAPITCSTFIEDDEIDGKRNKTVCEVDRYTHTTNKTISMEMTSEINGVGIQISQNTFLQNKNLNTKNYIKNDMEKDSKENGLKESKNATVQKLEDDTSAMKKLIAHSHSLNVNVVNDQDMESMCIDTCVPKQLSIEQIEVIRKSRNILQTHEHDNVTRNQNKRQRTLSLSDSDDTIRSSLNVNTSLDTMTTASKARNVQKLNECNRIIDNNQEFTTTNNKEPVALENQRKTIDSVWTLLQMNTSVDSIRKTWRKSNSLSEQSSIQDKHVDDLMGNHSSVDGCSSASENKEEDVDSLENISLIERLRNISTRKQISERSNNKKRTDNGFSNIINVKCHNNERVNNSGDSYVAATPYPISRSVLLKSQLRYKTQTFGSSTASSSNNINSVITEEGGDKSAVYPKAVPNEVPVSNKTSKTNEADKIILENRRNKTASKIEEKIITPQNTECSPTRKGRKKLLPLYENSQLCSLTPLEENTSECTSESPISVKKNKILKKKQPKRKLADSKNKTSVTRNIVNEETWSDSDYDTFKNKKKEEKKRRKPRKVVSKKIVIKKFAEENVLNILKKNEQDERDRTTENRDSLDDFVNNRTISTQWNKYKSQKIVIVTTGLSKGDKNLVKSIIKSLGAAEMELNVSRRTTHVVSTGVRTMNLLRGIIRGCWLITLEWVLKSLENNAWLNPEEFEMKHFSKAVQENRKDRQLFGPSYIPELFTACGFIYVEHKTTVPCDTLKELVKTAGGHITENVKFAKIIIGENGLKETWVIDSITTGELQLSKLYERK
ncbi:hypothetical protein DMN91_007487 [Ooceraea biroi]|uniref:Microcephalin n=1 Tax=Ooceraea biroi TaxID=2015173 RepID=A0A026WXB1_OOCBI|nr:uncharacterized protein LOC105288021 [Ooceraea biroi]EZA60652.1 Microcephalin [Ooceraea biroi]RLU20873.1 hypothetical protein DMN91_007487 [Ooceraea biroi]